MPRQRVNKGNESALQKEAAKRVNRLAPPSSALNFGGAVTGGERQFKQFVGGSSGVAGTPTAKIDSARALARRTEADELKAKSDLLLSLYRPKPGRF